MIFLVATRCSYAIDLPCSYIFSLAIILGFARGGSEGIVVMRRCTHLVVYAPGSSLTRVLLYPTLYSVVMCSAYSQT